MYRIAGSCRLRADLAKDRCALQDACPSSVTRTTRRRTPGTATVTGAMIVTAAVATGDRDRALATGTALVAPLEVETTLLARPKGALCAHAELCHVTLAGRVQKWAPRDTAEGPPPYKVAVFRCRLCGRLLEVRDELLPLCGLLDAGEDHLGPLDVPARRQGSSRSKRVPGARGGARNKEGERARTARFLGAKR